MIAKLKKLILLYIFPIFTAFSQSFTLNQIKTLSEKPILEIEKNILQKQFYLFKEEVNSDGLACKYYHKKSTSEEIVICVPDDNLLTVIAYSSTSKAFYNEFYLKSVDHLNFKKTTNFSYDLEKGKEYWALNLETKSLESKFSFIAILSYSKVKFLLKGENVDYLSFEDLQKSKISLSKYKEKYLYLCFWTDWYEPSKVSMIALKNYFESLTPSQKSKILPVFINCDEDVEFWTRSKLNIVIGEYPNLFAGGNLENIKELFSIETFPNFSLINEKSILEYPNYYNPSEQYNVDFKEELTESLDKIRDLEKV